MSNDSIYYHIGNYALSLACTGSACSAAGLLLSDFVSKQRQQLAYGGDENAGRKLILPCYKPLYRCLITFFAVSSVIIASTFGWELGIQEQVYVLQFYYILIMAIYMLAPVLLIQKSGVSRVGLRNTFASIGVWLLCSIILWISLLASKEGNTKYGIGLLLAHVISVPPFVLSILILSRTIYSRIQFRSWSNRASLDFLIVYSVVVYAANVTTSAVFENSNSYGYHSQLQFSVLLAACISFLSNFFYPLSLYRTLLADTKYWRGMGKYNRNGMSISAITAINKNNDDSNVSNSTICLNVAASSFQTMVSSFSEFLIDFAYIRLDRPMGSGSTATVYSGTFTKKTKCIVDVAIKIITPQEITEDIINVFMVEAQLHSKLSSPYIVTFHGLCIRPPQLAMVLEICEYGNLQNSLKNQPDMWTPQAKLIACLDAARGLLCLHKNNYIHRDLKTENFFVAGNLTVKLGDFGESIPVREQVQVIGGDEDEIPEKMPIVGSVAYMAPELISNVSFYDQKIDIYALGITLWELWNSQVVYPGMDNFKIYEYVTKGNRPPVVGKDFMTVAGLNSGKLIDLMQRCWDANPAFRPTASAVVEMLIELIEEYRIKTGLPLSACITTDKTYTDRPSETFFRSSSHTFNTSTTSGDFDSINYAHNPMMLSKNSSPDSNGIKSKGDSLV